MPSQLSTQDEAPASALWQKPLTSPSAHQPLASPLSPAEARVKNPGRRYAQIVKLKPEHYARYKEVHGAVWPEVAKQIKNCNIIDCMSCGSSFLCLFYIVLPFCPSAATKLPHLSAPPSSPLLPPIPLVLSLSSVLLPQRGDNEVRRAGQVKQRDAGSVTGSVFHMCGYGNRLSPGWGTQISTGQAEGTVHYHGVPGTHKC